MRGDGTVPSSYVRTGKEPGEFHALQRAQGGKKSERRTMKKLVYKSNVQRAVLERNTENTVAKSS